MRCDDVGEKWLLPIVANLRAIPLIIFAISIHLIYQQLSLLDTRFGLALILCRTFGWSWC
jgi:multiple sugar transport system permease protein